jgi:hypothetical protein
VRGTNILTSLTEHYNTKNGRMFPSATCMLFRAYIQYVVVLADPSGLVYPRPMRQPRGMLAVGANMLGRLESMWPHRVSYGARPNGRDLAAGKYGQHTVLR